MQSFRDSDFSCASVTARLFTLDMLSSWQMTQGCNVMRPFRYLCAAWRWYLGWSVDAQQCAALRASKGSNSAWEPSPEGGCSGGM